EKDCAIPLQQQAVHLVLQHAVLIGADEPAHKIKTHDRTRLTLSNLHMPSYRQELRPACASSLDPDNGQSRAPQSCPSLPGLSGPRPTAFCGREQRVESPQPPLACVREWPNRIRKPRHRLRLRGARGGSTRGKKSRRT